MEFVGQIQILNEIKSVLEDSPGDRQVALYGLGGIGFVAPVSYRAIHSLYIESRR